jgi:hypothetical protein
MSNPDRKLEREKAWYKVYSSPAHPRIYESKFACGEARITLLELLPQWEGWNAGERVQFAQAFGQKGTLNGEDERILEFLMGQGDGRIASVIARLSTKYPDRIKALSFLSHWIEAFPENRTNFVQALSVLTPESEPMLSRIYHQSEAKISCNPHDHEAIIDLLYSSVGLFKLLRQQEYREKITRFLKHPNSSVSAHASLCLWELSNRK